MVQSEIIQRVLRIRYSNSAASAFTLEYNGIQFVITAKHVFESKNYPTSAVIEVLLDGVYESIPVDIKYPADVRIDIAVLKTNPYRTLTKFFGNKCTTEGLVYGQDVYFLGYPYNYDSLLVSYPGSKSPAPFVKKACMSGMLSPSPSILFLDGHNNPGFSGGPVCFKRGGDKLFSIAGVVSGYRYDEAPLFDKDNHQTNFYIKENTGIINVSDISFAVNIAKEWSANL